MPLPPIVPQNLALVRVANYLKSVLAVPPDEQVMLRRFVRLTLGELPSEVELARKHGPLPALPTNLGPGCRNEDAAQPTTPKAPVERPAKPAGAPTRPSAPGSLAFSPHAAARIRAAQAAAAAKAGVTPPPGLPPVSPEVQAAHNANAAEAHAQAAERPGIPTRVVAPEAGVLSTHAPTVSSQASLSSTGPSAVAGSPEDAPPPTPKEGQVASLQTAVEGQAGAPARLPLAPSEVPNRSPAADVKVTPGLPARV